MLNHTLKTVTYFLNKFSVFGILLVLTGFISLNDGHFYAGNFGEIYPGEVGAIFLLLIKFVGGLVFIVFGFIQGLKKLRRTK